MELSKYDEKHVRVTHFCGDTFTGVADYYDADYCWSEFGKNEECIIIGEDLLPVSEIVSIEEIEVHGTAELRTERLILRRYRPEDADDLYQNFGAIPEMYRYSGWNPYATPEMARETVAHYIESYQDEHFYGWAMDFDSVLFGTIGAYDYKGDTIEVGFSVDKACWGHGYATEALQAVLAYLTENEGIPCVTAWCAAENIGSKKVLDKAGMQFVRMEKDGLKVGDRTYDILHYEYRPPSV